jgi:multidrug transporter EmrE-like cation transporter
MEPNRKLPLITEQVRQYLETEYRLIKLESIDTAGTIFAELITEVIIVIWLIITLIFLSISLALLAAQLLHSIWKGFGCITFLYMMMGLSIRLFKIKIRNLLIRILIKKLAGNKKV